MREKDEERRENKTFLRTEMCEEKKTKQSRGWGKWEVGDVVIRGEGVKREGLARDEGVGDI